MPNLNRWLRPDTTRRTGRRASIAGPEEIPDTLHEPPPRRRPAAPATTLRPIQSETLPVED